VARWLGGWVNEVIDTGLTGSDVGDGEADSDGGDGEADSDGGDESPTGMT